MANGYMEGFTGRLRDKSFRRVLATLLWDQKYIFGGVHNSIWGS